MLCVHEASFEMVKQQPEQGTAAAAAGAWPFLLLLAVIVGEQYHTSSCLGDLWALPLSLNRSCKRPGSSSMRGLASLVLLLAVVVGEPDRARVPGTGS